MTDFASFGLSAPILSALVKAEYTVPTPIQTQAIPHVMRGADLLGIAQTGTGKTAAFALPIIHRLMAERRPYVRNATRCLVLAPTRELASQIAESFRTYGRMTGVRVAVIFGGVPKGRQIQAVSQGVDVIVATPGRLLDLFGERHIRLDQTEILVLDEADHMLDLGFVIPIRRIAKELPAVRQNLFFAFLYNALGIPVAAGLLYPFFGLLLSPMIAGAAMSLSSVSVIGNALRLKRARL